jgi:formylglycine-generating enzyme required for sulfatase activity
VRWTLFLIACSKAEPVPIPPAPIEAAIATLEASTLPIADASQSRSPEGMLLVPGGTFTMGTDKGGEPDEHPAHDVTLADFFLDRTEVTNAAYSECVAAKICKPKAFTDFSRSEQPVSAVSWDDAKTFCEWKGKRLPTEAEFERAMRGTDGRRHPWGDDPPTHERTVFETTAPDDVGSHPAGRGPYGHDDLMGNVWEWTADDYDPYAYRRPGGRPGSCAEIQKAQDELRDAGKQGFTGANPIPKECERSIRAGAYNYLGVQLRSTDRVHHPGRFHIPMLGFRCASSVGSKDKP